MSKFKVGDMVRVVDRGRRFSAYETFVKKHCPQLVTKFRPFNVLTNGEIGKVKAVARHLTEPNVYGDILVILCRENVFVIEDRGVEPITNDFSIHITSDGKTTTAVLAENSNVIHKAESKCSPDDVFDFETGAKLAFERLMEERKPKAKPQKREFKVGDRVRIRQCDDMAAEFGTRRGLLFTSISTVPSFVPSMKPLCGRTATISDIAGKDVLLVDWSDTSGDTSWGYCLDMLEPANEIPSDFWERFKTEETAADV